MRKDSVLDQFRLYFDTALLGAHFNFRSEGFRQKDVRFLIELFTNWMESTVGEIALTVHNAQILRYLGDMEKAGAVVKVKKQKVPRYQLSRAGLVNLLSSLVEKAPILPLEQFFFLHYFLKSYGKLFGDLVKQDEHLSPSLKAELMSLYDPALVLKNQLRFIEKEIAKLSGRIQETLDASGLAEKIIGEGGTPDQAVIEIQKQFPYDLNSRKPLKELMAELPVDLRPWELSQGFRNRALSLWTPLKAYFEAYRAILSAMK